MTEMTEITLLDDSSSENDDSNSDENVNIEKSPFLSDSSRPPKPISSRKVQCWAVFASITTLLFLMLWLAESQFSSGILRYRYLDEECGYRLFGNLKCAPGLNCAYTRCQVPTPRPTPFPSNQVSHKSNCPRCPVCPSSQIVHKTASYFDFNEFPNYWIDPGPHGFISLDYNMPYGGCKEICARNPKCEGICYVGFDKSCRQMTKGHHSQPRRNITWNCAIKTNTA